MEDPNPTVSIPNLPNELIIEILTRLPVKPLLKFRCVCKSWRALISSQEFVRNHLKISNSDHRVMLNCGGNLKQFSVDSMLYEPVTEALELDGSVQAGGKLFWMVGSCDGLVCLVTEGRDLFLWNPCTRICKKLPDFGLKTEVGGYFSYGFGSTESSGDYKVVAMYFDRRRDLSEEIVQVYSLRSDKWRRINHYAGCHVMSHPAKFVKGKLYWFASTLYGLEIGWAIVSLDLEEEEFEFLQMPRYVKSSFPLKMAVSGGSLYGVCNNLESADVWMMDGGSGVGEVNWRKVVTIPYSDDFLKNSPKLVLHVLKNGEVLLLCGLMFVIFDPKDCSFRYPEIRNSGEFISVGAYVESLVSPFG